MTAASTLSSTTRMRFAQHRLGRALGGRVGLRRRPSQQRDAQRELGALVLALARGLQRAAVRFGDAARQSEADAEAGPDLLQRRPALDEHVEDPLQHAGLDAAAVVAHPDHRPAVFPLRPHRDAAACGV